MGEDAQDATANERCYKRHGEVLGANMVACS